MSVYKSRYKTLGQKHTLIVSVAEKDEYNPPKKDDGIGKELLMDHIMYSH